MHHIYYTKGFILGSRNVGEANKMLTIYTRELGFVRAMTQGVRLHKSKLRFALQDFTYANIDLVRGRDIWRVTSAIYKDSFPYARKKKKPILLIARVSKLIERLCTGEEPNSRIFDDLIQTFHLLDSVSIKSESIEALELHLVLRIMNSLGYIGESTILAPYLNSDFDSKLEESLLEEKKSIITYINRALNESQL